MLTVQEWKEVAKEAAQRSNNKVETIIFQDGTVSTVTGSWEARKPVLLVLPNGKHDAKNVFVALKRAINDLEYWEGEKLIIT